MPGLACSRQRRVACICPCSTEPHTDEYYGFGECKCSARSLCRQPGLHDLLSVCDHFIGWPALSWLVVTLATATSVARLGRLPPLLPPPLTLRAVLSPLAHAWSHSLAPPTRRAQKLRTACVPPTPLPTPPPRRHLPCSDIEDCMRAHDFQHVNTVESDPRHRVVLGHL